MSALPPLPAGEAQWVETHGSGYPLGILRTSRGGRKPWRLWLIDDRCEFLGAFDNPQAARRALYDRHWLTRKPDPEAQQ
jgi:hypothetical protein